MTLRDIPDRQTVSVEIDRRMAEDLMRYAALQFPGSVENRFTRSPVQLLVQDCSNETFRVPLDDTDDGEPEFFYDVPEGTFPDEPRKGFKTLRELVAAMTETTDPPGRRPDERPSDYLAAHGVDPSDVVAWRRIVVPKVMAASFSRKCCRRAEKALDNHIFDPVRIYAQSVDTFGRSASDLPSMQAMALRAGTALLRRELTREGIRVIPRFVLREGECMARYRSSPGQPWRAASYLVTKAIFHREVIVGTLDVICRGVLLEDPRIPHPSIKASRQVVLAMMGEPVKTVPWPFECRKTFESLLMKEPQFPGDRLSPAERLFAWAAGIEPEDEGPWIEPEAPSNRIPWWERPVPEGARFVHDNEEYASLEDLAAAVAGVAPDGFDGVDWKDAGEYLGTYGIDPASVEMVEGKEGD